MNSPVYPRPHITALPQVLKDGLIFPLAVLDHRCHNHEALSLGELQNGINDLLHRLAGDLPSAPRAMRVAHPGEEEPQVVIYLSHRAHDGAGVAAGPFLVDGDRRA